ncbi:MAG: hypothetical protein LC791_12700 [Acidobacteria bacterium]|nr:hypothetical protein [Acidobacteriota bacterium]
MCCSLGVLGAAEGLPITWTLLGLVALSAGMMPSLLAWPALVPAPVQPHVEVTR